MSILSIENLSFSYEANHEILKIKKFEIQKGEKVFLYGPSGSGKSTFLNLVAGVILPKSGEVKLLDKNISLLSQAQRDHLRGDHIGYIFQSFNLIPYLTIEENISLPCRLSSARRNRLKRNLKDEIANYAQFLGLEKLLNKKVTDLSIGQQQRVAVARALLGDPEILIADEPTSSLDADMVDRFMQLILKEHEEKKFTLLFVSHDQRLKQYFDRQISLKEINQVVAQ